ncbi:hypothetical protein PA25_07510 [Pseudoalteromonas sp. A25]|uniref:intermembrane phospholipid transport protein YdbH family protein n=1 Tax=Pseudoalteromonas sp. A25 TaxID=116092 RepID=UPI001260DE23|nr:YdbH domain-containing protein [Pseudoalteromonas sp. A25]BBN80766.1 hypothetical protein PA25_07510 [Pseudoalteromonas sp. A25]
MIVKFFKWLVIILCCLFLGLYVFREPLTVMTAERYLAPYNMSLSCLRWSLGGWHKVNVEELCLDSEHVSLRLEQVKVTKEHIHVNALHAKLLNSNTQEQSQAQTLWQPLQLALPTRPLLNIDDVTIETDKLSLRQLPQVLRLSLQEHKLNSFSVTGDISSDIFLSEQAVKLDVELDSPALQQLLPIYITSLHGTAHIDYFGDKVDLNVQHALAANLESSQCNGLVTSQGHIKASFDINLQKLDADLSEAEVLLTPNECDLIQTEQLREELNRVLLQPWRVSLPNGLALHNSRITTEHVQFSSADGNSVAEVKVLNADSKTLYGSGVVSIAHHSDSIGKLEIKSPIEFSDGHVNGMGKLHYHGERLLWLSEQVQGIELQGQVEFEASTQRALYKVEASGEVEQAYYNGVKVNNGKANMNAEITVAGDVATFAKLTIQADTLSYQQVKVKNSQLELEVDISSKQQLALSGRLSNQLLQSQSVQVNGIGSQFSVAGNIGSGEIFTTLSAQTRLDTVKAPNITLNNINIDSQGLQSRTGMFEHFITGAGIEAVLKHQYSPLAHPYQLVATAKPIMSIQPLINAYVPKLKLVQGDISFESEGDFNLQTADFLAQVNDVSLLYGTHYVDEINTAITGQYNSGTINIPSSKVMIGQIRSGVVLSNLSTLLHVDNGLAYVSELDASVFAGSVNIDRLNLSSEPQLVQVNAESLDLGLIAQAGRDAGVELRGKISGTFPMRIVDTNVSIEQGKLLSVGQGKLQVAQNASIEALKAQQPSLKSVIGVLDDLTIDNLSSDVALTPDGWLTLGVQIVGENKQQSQPVNFNYTHQENIFTLFRALRLSDEITQKVEDALTKQEQSP